MTHEDWNGHETESHAFTDLKEPSATGKQNAEVKPARSLSRKRAPQPWQRRLVIGITAFRRPRHLQRLVSSIRDRYPELPIVVADNGDQPARLPSDVRVLQLPFDCGLSCARNALINATRHDYFLLLEEDFVFTEETRLQEFVDILEHDPEVGVVGGALICNGIKQEYAVRFDRWRETLRLHPATGGYRVTDRGVTYQLCDMCFNFALFRRDMLSDHRWDESLKLGEHYPFFDSVQRAGKWRVANCDAVRAEHDMGDRSDDYQAYRSRARAQYLDYLNRQGIRNVEADPQVKFRPADFFVSERPNVVILGVGHSGTSILSRTLLAAGWHCQDADDEFSESVLTREINIAYMQTKHFDATRAAEVLKMGQPWVLKDPRFVFTLSRWKALFARQRHPPVLVWIRRSVEEVVASYRRRGELGDHDPYAAVESRVRLAQREYECWPWSKLALEYEDLDRCAQFVRQAWRGDRSSVQSSRTTRKPVP